ncbi:MAG: prepilin-type N-terminal cleavage/methylation domain-containing protein [Desulfosudaceae bacterium]
MAKIPRIRAQTTGKKTASGFSLIEVVIAMGLVSIGLAAITSAVISTSRVSRTTVLSDQAVFWGQDIMEGVGGIPMEAPLLAPGETKVLSKENRRAELTAFNPVDQDGDGRDDYRTIVTRVWVTEGQSERLCLENYYLKPAP